MSTNLDSLLVDTPQTSLWDRSWFWAKRLGFFLIVWSQMSMCSHIEAISKNRAPSLVQTSSGLGLPVTQHPPNHREPALIRQFVMNFITMTLSWDNSLSGPDGKPIADKGQPIGEGRVPTELWASTWLLDELLRASWLSNIAGEFDLGPYMDGSRYRTVRVEYLSDPQELEPGVYEVTVVANWYDFSKKNKVGKRTPWNRKITLKAIPSTVQQLTADAGIHEQVIYKLLSSGLLVTGFTTLPDQFQPAVVSKEQPS